VGPSFKAWLSESCKRLGVNATRLHFGVARAGYFCREETVRRWMKGELVAVTNMRSVHLETATKRFGWEPREPDWQPGLRGNGTERY
jgi:hypothetical protein